ncbi:MAG: diaminopimelate epimerase [Elusimicrobiota bacterium]
MEFYKITAAGNDFILLYNIFKTKSQIKNIAIKLCDRHYGIGADGLLILNKKGKEYFLDYLNSDGSFAFCGNGTRSAAWWIYKKFKKTKNFYINTSAGKLYVLIKKDDKIYLEMPKPDFIKDIDIDKNCSAKFVRVGTNHLVIEAENIDRLDVFNIGRNYRYDKRFSPQGTNVDFVEVLGLKNQKLIVKIRTYEKGVEEETYSCSSGIASSFYALIDKYNQKEAIFISKMGQRFHLYFDKNSLYMFGPVKIVFRGWYELF